METDCPCGMFQSQGTCYHTGYKPTFHGKDPLTSDRVIQAIERAAAKFKQENEVTPDILTKATRIQKANELREQATDLERG